MPKDDPIPPVDPNAQHTNDRPDAAHQTVATFGVNSSDLYEVDEVIDAAFYAIYKFHLFEADDPRVVATMKAVEEKLWVKTRVGGVARYENDYYHRISNDIAAVPGNPWFICTLWLADYFITRATTAAELKIALPIFEWTASHALESGVLAEQVNPYTNEPLSVSPLTWSHATVVSHGHQIPGKARAVADLQHMQSAGLPPAPQRAGRSEEPGDFRSQFDAGFESERRARNGVAVGQIHQGRPAHAHAAEGDAGDRHARLHRLRRLRRPLRQRRAADGRWQSAWSICGISTNAISTANASRSARPMSSAC